MNTIHANDFKFYEELDEVIQREPSEMFSPELLGIASAIGIQKGKPFNPSFAQKKLLTEAVAIGNATARSILFSPAGSQGLHLSREGWFLANRIPWGQPRVSRQRREWRAGHG